MSSECARHPGVTAVDLCARCGTFLCAECVEYQRDDVPLCQPCLTLVREVPASVRARALAVMGALAVLTLVAGFFVKGRPGLFLWAGASVMATVGFAWSMLEGRRLRALPGVQRGLRWVRAGLVLSAIAAVGFLALAASFVVFISRAR